MSSLPSISGFGGHAHNLKSHDRIEPPVPVHVDKAVAVRQAGRGIQGLQLPLPTVIAKPFGAQDKIEIAVAVTKSGGGRSAFVFDQDRGHGMRRAGGLVRQRNPCP